jgi:hypothetical protein
MNNLGSRMLKCQNLQVLTYEVRPQVFINFVFHSRPLLFFFVDHIGPYHDTLIKFNHDSNYLGDEFISF